MERYPGALVCVFLLLGSLTGTAVAQTYTNPLITTGFPAAGGWSSGPADPCVLEYEGVYYVYPTVSGFNYRVMGSDNLVDWTGNRIVFEVPPGSPWKTWMLWAPDVRYLNGRFYLYYTAGTGELNGQRVGVADCDVPIGPFLDRSFDAPLITDPSIDAHLFQDGDEL